jgi:hypothetical protein
MSPEMQVQPPEARLAAPRQSLGWIPIALTLLIAGALSFGAGVIHWDPCFTDGFDSAGCSVRQSDPSDLTGFTVLPSDQRLAAIMLASSKLVIGLLWFSLVLVGGASASSLRRLAGRIVASIGGACYVVAALAELWWFARGQVLLDSYDIMRFAVFGFIATIPAAVLLWRPRERRLDLLLLGLLAGSWLGAVVDYFFWMMIHSSHDTPPGTGLAQAAAYLGTGAGILYLTLADTSARHGRAIGSPP